MATELDRMEEVAKNWQIDALEKRLLGQERFNEQIDSKLNTILMNQATPKQLEEMRTSMQRTFDDRIKAVEQTHNADIRELNLKYGPTTRTLNKMQATIVTAIIAQLVYVLFNVLGS